MHTDTHDHLHRSRCGDFRPEPVGISYSDDSIPRAAMILESVATVTLEMRHREIAVPCANACASTYTSSDWSPNNLSRWTLSDRAICIPTSHFAGVVRTRISDAPEECLGVWSEVILPRSDARNRIVKGPLLQMKAVVAARNFDRKISLD